MQPLEQLRVIDAWAKRAPLPAVLGFALRCAERVCSIYTRAVGGEPAAFLHELLAKAKVALEGDPQVIACSADDVYDVLIAPAADGSLEAFEEMVVSETSTAAAALVSALRELRRDAVPRVAEALIGIKDTELHERYGLNHRHENERVIADHPEMVEELRWLAEQMGSASDGS
ncbi:MAG: hypothetical protein QM778_23515 [Myxococcales bacterium]